MNPTTLRAPFGWVGGKSALAKKIVELMPEHKMYIEVFGGALNVLYRKPIVKREIINDINGDLINLHQVIKNHPETLREKLKMELKSREIFNRIKRGEYEIRGDIDRAMQFYYRIKNTFGCNQTTFAETNVMNLAKDFKKYSERLRRVTIENKSFDEIIKHYDRDYSLFYLDPHYVGTEKYYDTGFGIKEHKELAELLKNIKGRFMLSYEDNEMIRELYKDYYFKTITIDRTLNNTGKRKRAIELIISNFKLQEE
ncbi:DNA adenine methylase [Helicobacter anatolicus]|uniref:DNA adenine methylase n=1 Tax=Helicobacter anatolicus TaxID=2905874 RepID=UPI001E4092DD|nr:DNA adenine methylase [Helicobacter anatolicus]MCE3040121.1 DNA adenine methylase [Helicobacter anatolicus]